MFKNNSNFFVSSQNLIFVEVFFLFLKKLYFYSYHYCAYEMGSFPTKSRHDQIQMSGSREMDIGPCEEYTKT